MTLQTDAQILQKFIRHMPGLSTTMSKVVEVCNDPTATPSLLKQVIALDPVLTGSVIRLVNSAYCGLVNPVTSLARAIILLGVNTVKNMAMTISILGVMQQGNRGQAFNMDYFWAHSLAVGSMARSIAGLLKLSRAEMEIYFVAGLLHDVGKLPLMACFKARYREAVDSASSTGTVLHAEEKRLFGMDHMQVGGMIAAKWRLDGTIARSIEGHHGSLSPEEQFDSISTTVGLADAMAYHFNFGSAGNAGTGALPFVELAKKMKLDPLLLLGMRPQIEMEIEKARIFLQLTA